MPRDLKVVEGQTATLTCNVDGSPPPRVTWSRGAPPRQVSSGNRVTVHADGSLEIRVTICSITDLPHSLSLCLSLSVLTAIFQMNLG